MAIGKYKYYFRKPKSAIVKDVLSWLLVGGLIAIAATSPYFVHNLLQGYNRWKKYSRGKISSTFYTLKRKGFIDIQRNNKQIFISLTPMGKERAGMFQIDNLEIKKPKVWDQKWRLLSFDISEKKKIIREALRGKLKELGFHLFQKSIWIHPFDCSAEIELLTGFFGLSHNEVQLIVAEHIGEDKAWQRIFRLSS